MEDVKPTLTILEADKNPLSCIKQCYFVKDFVHKFFVYHTYGLPRNVVLESIMTAVDPQDFIPYNYNIVAESATFFVKNCILAIKQLCTQNLLVRNIYDETIFFKLQIVLGYSNTDDGANAKILNRTQKIVSERFNWSTNIMDFDNFHNDKDLLDYCPLSQPKILLFVLQMCKLYTVGTLKLSNNNIKELPEQFSRILPNVTALDLSNNKIESLDNIYSAARCAHITNLLLEGNPICNTFAPLEYIKQIHKLFPKITHLDGICLSSTELLPIKSNFLCDIQGQNFVEEFLEEFYAYYDSVGQRRQLMNLYHNQAMFSLTKNHFSGQNSSYSANFKPYEPFARNFKFMADLSKGKEKLFVGFDAIFEVFDQLPQSEHDPATFTIDLVKYTEKIIIITLTGVFRDIGSNLNDDPSYFGFTRTFVLTNFGIGNRFLISNDQLHINNALTTMQSLSFKHYLLPKNAWLDIPPAQLKREEKELIRAVNNICGLNFEWSKKILQQCEYNLSVALETVISDIHNFPPDAFKGDFLEENEFVVTITSKKPQEVVKQDEASSSKVSGLDLILNKIKTLLDKSNEIGFSIKNNITEVNSTINKFLALNCVKLHHHFNDVYILCKKYSLTDLQSKVGAHQMRLEHTSLKVYGEQCSKIVNKDFKDLQKADRQVYIKLLNWFDAGLCFEFDFPLMYQTLDKLGFQDVRVILEGFEKQVVLLLLNCIKTLKRVQKLQTCLNRLEVYLRNGHELNRQQYEIVYDANVRSNYALDDKSLLNIAKHTLEEEDYLCFEDYIIDDTFKFERSRFKKASVEILNYRLENMPDRLKMFQEHLPKIKRYCPITADKLFEAIAKSIKKSEK